MYVSFVVQSTINWSVLDISRLILIGSLTLPGRSLAGHLCSNRQRRHPRVTLGRAGSLAAACVVPFGHRLEGNPMETHHRQMIFHDYPIQNLHLLGLCRRASLESRCSSDHPEASSMTWVQKLPQDSCDLWSVCQIHCPSIFLTGRTCPVWLILLSSEHGATKDKYAHVLKAALVQFGMAFVCALNTKKNCPRIYKAQNAIPFGPAFHYCQKTYIYILIIYI